MEQEGWIDSWQLRARNDVHPSHELHVCSTKELEKILNHTINKIEDSEFGITGTKWTSGLVGKDFVTAQIKMVIIAMRDENEEQNKRKK